MTAPINDDAADLEPDAPVTPDAPAADSGKPWSPPASQADLDKIIESRLARERAKYGDIDALREKASYWDELETAAKDEYEQQAEALTAAEARYIAAQARIVTAELRAAGVPAELIEDLDLSRFIDGDGEIDESRIGALRDKYAALNPGQRMAPNPAQGTSAQPPLSLAERIAQASAAGDTKTALRLKAAMAVGGNTSN